MTSAIENDSFNELSNDHRSTIMCNGVLQADRQTYEKLLEFYGNSSKPNAERVLLLQTIGCIEHEEILNDFILKYDEVPLSQFLTLIQAVYANGPIGLRVTQNFLRENQTEFSQL
jgi:hypothetical protein